MQGADRSSADPFRPDLEGLRGIAILLVLAFHAGLPYAGGGFVGVDVFFVLSGFLITGLLVRERERTGRIDLRAFYARRARRILPAAAVVLLATLALSWVLLSPLDLIRVSQDALASALSAGNVRFAIEATDYFSAGQTPSPFLHYWSLGVEEQFYLLWPALLLGAMALPRPRVSAGLVLALVLAGSLGLAVVLTDASPAFAFYSLPSRAWQLALGGLLSILVARRARSSPASETDPVSDVFAEGPDPAVSGPAIPAPAPARRRRVPGLLLALTGWAGLLAILAAVLLVDPSTPYPGLAALAPSLGAAALIGAGEAPFSPGALLVLAPLRALGRISYSLYLVHWPILVLPAASLALGEELPLEGRLGLAGLSILLAALCYRAVELPFQRGRVFALRPGRTLALAGASIAATAVIALGVGTVMSRDLDSSLAAATTAPDPGTATAGPGGEVALGPAEPGGLAGGVPNPQAAPPPIIATGAAAPSNTTPVPASALPPSSAVAPTGQVAGAAPSTPAGSTASPDPSPATGPPPAGRQPLPAVPLRHPTGAQPLPAGIRPPLLKASRDEEKLVTNGCNLQPAQVNLPDCIFGNRDGTFTVALVGDSHTSQWFPALERIATQRGWRLLTFTKYDCRFMDIRIYSAFLKREYTECAAWRDRVVQRLQAIQPNLVIVGVSRFPQVIDPADGDPVRQGRALARTLAQVPGEHAILVDTPRSNFDVPACISGHLADVTPCETSRTDALLSRHRIVERTAAQIDHATLVDLTAQICPWDRCPVVLNGMIVYRDNHHLTATFAASLADAVAAALPDVDQPAGTMRSPLEAGAHRG